MDAVASEAARSPAVRAPGLPLRAGADRLRAVAGSLATARSVAVAAALLVAAAGAYVAARETSVFALRTVEVTGARPGIAAQVRRAVAPLVGTSLVPLDGKELERDAEELPAVRSARVDRAFPHALEVVVREERPLAVVRDAAHAWLVSENGRVIRASRSRALPRVPRVWLDGIADLRPGEALVDTRLRVALHTLAHVPRPFPARVLAVRADGRSVTLVLAGGTELRLGSPTHVRQKLEAAAAVLESLSAPARRELAYVDLALPDRPVAAEKLSSRR